MSSSYTTSTTSTFTESRAREVMGHVHADFMAVAARWPTTRERLSDWHEEIEAAVLMEAVATFELQLTPPSGQRAALRYVVHDDGSISGGVRAGGLDLYAFHSDTKVSVCLSYRDSAPRVEEARKYLRGRGWTPNGSLVEGSAERDRAYAAQGYGLARQKVGVWP